MRLSDYILKLQELYQIYGDVWVERGEDGELAPEPYAVTPAGQTEAVIIV